jgi:phosphotransferase family enzyme
VPEETEREVPLEGGLANHGEVVRVGDTVRRPQRRTSPATHALLRHLEDVGFDGAPRLLGVDDAGREVLSFIPGTAVTPPYPTWALTDAALVSVAHLVRDYHRAVSAFDPTSLAWPESPPPPFAGELVSHNDLNLDNIVFRDGRAVALIDFDLASPGSRAWDVAGAARLWAPLRPDRYIDDLRRGRVLDRFRLFVDAYGIADPDRVRLVSAVLRNHEWSYDIVGTAVANGHAAFHDYWSGGAMERAQTTRQWYLDRADVLRDALFREPGHPGRGDGDASRDGPPGTDP